MANFAQYEEDWSIQNRDFKPQNRTASISCGSIKAFAKN
jgi:hypothetical protein